jgi:hypothetical protein
MKNFKDYINEAKKFKVEVLLYIEDYGVPHDKDYDENDYDAPYSMYEKMAKKYHVKLEDAKKPLQYGDLTAINVIGKKEDVEKFIEDALGEEFERDELVDMFSDKGLFV